MTWVTRGRTAGAVVVLIAALSAPVGPVAARPVSPAQPPVLGPTPLPLGPAGLAETRTTSTLQRGLTLTSIVRGAADSTQVWTVEVSIPSTTTSPDPDAPAAALSDRASAEALVGRLRAAGFDPRVEEVRTPPTADYAAGSLGWRVRVGRFADKAAADVTLARLVAGGYAGASRFTGWDGDSSAAGPWRVRVLTINPRSFKGRLVASYGPDIERRETTSALSNAVGATAAVNAGYFVLDPASGAPGDPAGVGVYGGKLLSETVGRRPALVVQADGRTAVERLRWVGTVEGAQHDRLRLDGLNRVPGLIRNCGGLDDVPTVRPLHDFTCTDPDELVAFTSQFGIDTPTGPGLEAVLDPRGRVVSLRSPRGGPLLSGYRAVQATGSLVDDLRSAAVVGKRLTIRTGLRDPRGGAVRTRTSLSVVNGGPELVRAGQLHVTARADGFVRPAEPSFYYGFSAERNPRTFAGVDAAGRTVLVTVDGRSTSSLGLSLVETAAVAKALGMRSALNLDGGGSTTMVVDGRLTNQPSDATGERPVGDALLILPRR